jgi:ABC-type nitrate/sulfonate/bicarbonate transport system permease component
MNTATLVASSDAPVSRPTWAFRLPRRAFSPLILIALWEAGSRVGLIPARILADPARSSPR